MTLHLLCVKMINQISQCDRLCLIINVLNCSGILDVQQNGPAINVTFYIDGLKVDVDFTPTIAVSMPRWLTNRWPRSKWWPGKNWANDVIKRGLNLVAKGSDYFFNMSFGLCEKELSKFADSQGGVRKKCHRLMKQFAEDFWFPCDAKPFVDSYKLKVSISSVFTLYFIFSLVVKVVEEFNVASLRQYSPFYVVL
jgi:hypothetical protein